MSNTENTESLEQIECEEMEDGSLAIHVPDNMVNRIVQAFITDALYQLEEHLRKRELKGDD